MYNLNFLFNKTKNLPIMRVAYVILHLWNLNTTGVSKVLPVLILMQMSILSFSVLCKRFYVSQKHQLIILNLFHFMVENISGIKIFLQDGLTIFLPDSFLLCSNIACAPVILLWEVNLVQFGLLLSLCSVLFFQCKSGYHGFGLLFWRGPKNMDWIFAQPCK